MTALWSALRACSLSHLHTRAFVNSVVAQETADGELVVFHDEQSIARVCEDTASTAGHRRIRDMQAAEVKTLTLRRPPARPDSVAATLSGGSGGAAAAARVPTLAEFLYGKRVFGAIFILKMNVLPRQARDKDGFKFRKMRRFLQGEAAGARLFEAGCRGNQEHPHRHVWEGRPGGLFAPAAELRRAAAKRG